MAEVAGLLLGPLGLGGKDGLWAHAGAVPSGRRSSAGAPTLSPAVSDPANAR